ncbi:MAG: 30S ribosomal protein S3 [Lentisphaeria bacterium]|nr:30S ribosomal protein S3 [Victivallales bacterium]MCR4575972.1 30S ribosomal protein S3 [Lentisphaeria bacterium]
MGQKVNPIGFRLPVTKDWKSRWFARKAQFGPLLQEDLKIRDELTKELSGAAVSKIVIERFAKRVRVTIFTGRPGIVVSGKWPKDKDKDSKKGGEAAPAAAPAPAEGGAKGDARSKKNQGLDIIKDILSKIVGDKEVLVEIKEVRCPEMDAQLVSESVAQQLAKRVAFRRAMKRAIQTAMESGAEGIKIRCAGRLNGAELARTELYMEGKVPLHTLRANIDFGFSEAHTLAGLIGVKVWICKPQNWEETKNANDAKTRRSSKGTARVAGGNRKQQQ